MFLPPPPPTESVFSFSYCFGLAIQSRYCRKKRKGGRKIEHSTFCFCSWLVQPRGTIWSPLASRKTCSACSPVCHHQQLRPCPHLEQDVLSDCLSMQHLQSSASSEHLYNGKDGRSPGLGQDIFTGGLCRPAPR